MKKINLLVSALIGIQVAQLAINPSQAATIDSVSHIHSLKVYGDQILLGTHEGLHILKKSKDMQLIGKENFDVMGLAVLGKKLIASGHPGQGSKLPEPIGLIASSDSGKTWSKVSLQGKVDFHFIEANSQEIYGPDSQSGNLFYSKNAGKSWNSLGSNKYSDIAPVPNGVGQVIALLDGKLVVSKNALRSNTPLKTAFAVTQIEWIKSGLFAISESKLYKSSDTGKSWQLTYAFQKPISVFSANDKIIAAVQGSKVLISKDDGKSFREIIYRI